MQLYPITFSHSYVKNTTLLETPWIEITTGTVPVPGGVRQTMVVSPHEEPAPH